MNSTPQPKQPKARFYTRLNERDYLGVTVWPGKTDPTAEETETTGKLSED